MMTSHDTFLRLCRARDFMDSALDRRVRLDEAARQACLSRFHFHREFTRAFGETPLQFLTRRRMDRARWLLARGGHSVTQVCLEVGYESLGTFSTLFRSRVGCSPSEYQRALRRIHALYAVSPHRFIPACFLQFYGVPVF
jgi:AraC-like DNA-binding protein